MSEFIVPISRADLLSQNYSNHFFVSEVASLNSLGAHLSACEKELRSRGHFLVRDMFDYLYSVLYHWNKADNKLKELAWDISLLSCKKVTPAVVEVLNKMDKNDYFVYRNSVKMNVYLLCQFIELYEVQIQSVPLMDKAKGKHKKITAKFDWHYELQIAISNINQLFQCHIHNLWDPPTIEDDFINLVANTCYKLLENPDICKNVSIREGISKILTTLIKRYNHTKVCAIKLVGLLHSFPHTVSCILAICRDFLAAENMRNILLEIIQEICTSYSSQDAEHNKDATNSFISFLTDFASEHTQLIITILPHLKDKLQEDPYTMRNCVLFIMGEVIIKVYSGDVNQNSNRDVLLDIIEESILDINCFVRAKALGVLLSVVENNKLPLNRQARLMKILIGSDGAIFDTSSLARKNALKILTCMTNLNPAKGVRYEDLLKNIEQEKEVLKDMIKKLDELPDFATIDIQKRIEFIQEQIELTTKKEKRKSQTVPIESNDVAREFLNNGIIKLKGVIYILEQSVIFYECIQSSLMDVQSMLSSKVNSDVLEAINFFINAKLAGIDNVDNGVRKMLTHICSSEESIKTAVSKAYSRLYLEFDEDDERDKNVALVDSLTSLLNEPTYGELVSIEKLVVSFMSSGDIDEEVIKVLWKRFNSRSSEYSPFQKKAALIIFSMAASTNKPFMANYFQALINDGIPSTGCSSVDLQFIDYLCRSIQNIITNQVTQKHAEPIKFPKEHTLFERLINLSISTFSIQKKAYWIPMVNEVIATIYLLSENPDRICSKFIVSLANEMINGSKENVDIQKQSKFKCPAFMITRFLAVAGEVALKQFIHFDVSIQNELKRRNAIKEEREQAKQLKNADKKRETKSLEEEIGLVGASADDGDAEYIRLLCDNQLISDETKLLNRLLKFVEYICRNASKFNDVRLQTIASLSLGKMMLISSKEFTSARISLLFDIACRSPSEVIRANLIVPLGDLIRRFTLQMEPYTKDMYGRLRDSSPLVRLNALNVLSHLILNDMIKVKGWISEMTTCIIDDNPRIVILAKVFFQDLANKDKALFNVMPDIISRLSDPETTGVSEDKFRTIMEFLMPFIQKKNQAENLFDKILARFESSIDVRAWRDMSYCLSLINFSDYIVKTLSEKLNYFAGKVHVDEVYNAVNGIINNGLKNANKNREIETMLNEMSATLKNMRDKGVENEEVDMNVRKASKKIKSKPINKIVKEVIVPREKLNRSQKRTVSHEDVFSDDDSDFEESVPKQTAPRVSKSNKKPVRRRIVDSSESEDNESESD